jgi:4-oxalocrotonate tautomerase
MGEENLFRRIKMPVVHIYMYAGRSKEQKNEMVRRISKDFEDVLNVKPESLNVLFHDMEKSDWGIHGALASEPPSK